MRYSALIDSETLVITDSKTQETAEAIAVIPHHMPDLEAFVMHVPVEMAGELARMAAWRSLGQAAPAPGDFQV
ncbi:hypothetical protein [Pseudoxanthomonas sp. LARHCG66]